MSCIAYLVSDYDAPSHTFVRREVAALRAQGFDIRVYSIRPGGGTPALVGRSPFTYLASLLWALFTRPYRLATMWRLALSHRAPGLRALIWAQFHFVEAVLLARLLVDDSATRLHNHFANSGATVGLLAAHMTGIPWSLTLHGISETDYPAGVLLADKIRHAEFVACASYFMRAQAMRLVAPDQWQKMAIVRCGIALAELPGPKPERKSGPARLICVGRLSPEKGYYGLLDALARVREAGGFFELVIVGDGPLRGDVAARAEVLGFGGMLRFTGALGEAATLAEIADADILVLPSLMEGLPVVLIEAMALEKPVIAARVAGIPELVEDEHSGLLFTPSDWSGLAVKIEKLLGAAGDWLVYGRRGRARVEREFCAEHSAARMGHLFSGESLGDG